MKKDGQSIILLDGTVIVHESVLHTLYRLGDSGSRKYLNNFYFTHREKDELIHAMHHFVRDPAEDAFWKRNMKFLK